eukprot:4706228-Alexandrium_andersonii.AAC.1
MKSEVRSKSFRRDCRPDSSRPAARCWTSELACTKASESRARWWPRAISGARLPDMGQLA